MFNNLRFYRVHSEWPEDEAALSQKLAAAEFQPCGSITENSWGVEPPVDNAGDLLARRIAGADLLQMRVQTRVLPTAVVNEALDERIAAFKSRTDRNPSRKEKRDLKDEVYSELLPKTLLKSERMRGFYLVNEDILAVGTSSAPQAEKFIDVLRDGLGSLQAVPLAFRHPPESLLTKIFLGDEAEGFVLGRECRMRDTAEPKSSANWLETNLTDSSVRRHVQEGMEVDRLGLAFDGVLRCTLDGDLIMRKLRLEGIEQLRAEEGVDDPIAAHDAEFALYCGLIRKCLEGLKQQLGGYAT